MENVNLAVSQTVDIKLVEQFMELVANFDDETYLNNFYEDVDYEWDEIRDCETESSTTTYEYRSDIVGYIGELVIVDDVATWNPSKAISTK